MTPTPHTNHIQTTEAKISIQYKGGASEASGASELRYERQKLKSDTKDRS